MEKIIPYCGQDARVACDENCNKAWGVNKRPKVLLSKDDDDDYYFKPDDELGNAPKNPGTYEGDSAKPIKGVDQIPNKWCVRQCERCFFGKPDEPIVLPDFSKKIYNIPSKHNQ